MRNYKAGRPWPLAQKGNVMATATVQIPATGTYRIDRYAFGLTKKKGLAARYLDLEITAHATQG